MKSCLGLRTALTTGATSHVTKPRITATTPMAPHVAPSNNILTLVVDGKVDSTAESYASWGTLPALAVGNDVCVGADTTVAFKDTLGSITNVCSSTAKQTTLM